MRYFIAIIASAVLMIFCAFGCSSKPIINNITDAEVEGDEAIVEADAEETAIEIDGYGEEAINEEGEIADEVIKEEAAEEEAETECDPEGVVSWNAVSILDAAEFHSCSADVTQKTPGFYWANSVRKTASGRLYFGNQFGLFEYIEGESPVLNCVEGVSESVWSIESRSTDGVEELWVGLSGKIGIFNGADWRFEAMPPEWVRLWLPQDGPDSSAVWAMSIQSDRLLAQTTQGVAYRNEAGQWLPIDFRCDGSLTLPSQSYDYSNSAQKTVASSTWAGLVVEGDNLIVGGAGALYEIDLKTHSCKSRCPGANQDYHFIAQGVTSEGILAVYSKPGGVRRPGDFFYYMPYTENLEVGLCGELDDWIVKYSQTNPRTFIAGKSINSQWTGSFFNFIREPVPNPPWITGYTCDYQHHLYLSGDFNAAEPIKIGFGDSSMRDGMDCYVLYGWTASYIFDGLNVWYSPGFTKLTPR